MIQRKLVFILLVTFSTNGVFGDEPLKCYECDSSSDCITDLSKLTVKTCEADQKLCVTSVDDTGKVTRGCAKESCSTDKCVTCDKENCNKQNVCQTCDSSTDPSCAKSNSITAKFNRVCENPDTKCLRNIKTDKHTERRCAKSDDCPTESDTCKLCEGGNCNSGIFPSNRLDCYQCTNSNADCANVHKENNPLKSEPCTLYDAQEKCYMIGTDETHITRGCASDAGDQNKCKPGSEDKRCFTCDKSNCNERTYNIDQSLKCIQCQSTKDDTKCVWGQDEGSAKNCEKQIAYDAKEQCYTQLKDGIVYRGCYFDRKTDLGDCTDANSCTLCSDKNGCNRNDEGGFTCKRCRSDHDYQCWNKAQDIGGAKCTNPVTTDNDVCFHGIWNGIAIRGCLVDADPRDQAICNDKNNKQCITCKGKDCNIEKSAAASLSVVAVVTTILLAYLIQLF